VQEPLTVGRNVPLTPQVAVGCPANPRAHCAVQVALTPMPLQELDHEAALLGSGGRLVFEQTAQADAGTIHSGWVGQCRQHWQASTCVEAGLDNILQCARTHRTPLAVSVRACRVIAASNSTLEWISWNQLSSACALADVCIKAAADQQCSCQGHPPVGTHEPLID